MYHVKLARRSRVLYPRPTVFESGRSRMDIAVVVIASFARSLQRGARRDSRLLSSMSTDPGLHAHPPVFLSSVQTIGFSPLPALPSVTLVTTNGLGEYPPKLTLPAAGIAHWRSRSECVLSLCLPQPLCLEYRPHAAFDTEDKLLCCEGACACACPSRRYARCPHDGYGARPPEVESWSRNFQSGRSRYYTGKIVQKRLLMSSVVQRPGPVRRLGADTPGWVGSSVQQSTAEVMPPAVYLVVMTSQGTRAMERNVEVSFKSCVLDATFSTTRRRGSCGIVCGSFLPPSTQWHRAHGRRWRRVKAIKQQLLTPCKEQPIVKF